MNNMLEPLHRSYRMSLSMAVLLGVLAFGNFYFLEKYLETKALLAQCQTGAGIQAGEINQCKEAVTSLNDQNTSLSNEVQRLTNELTGTTNTIAALENQVAIDQQLIDDLKAQISLLSGQNSTDQARIEQLSNELEIARQDLADVQRQLSEHEQQLVVLQTMLQGITTLINALTWLGKNLPMISVMLAAMTGMPLVILNIRKPSSNRKRAVRKSQEHVHVLMTRQDAREYARRSRPAGARPKQSQLSKSLKSAIRQARS